MLSIGLDTSEGRFEQRVRTWLKDSAHEFDIIFACDDERTPQQLLQKLSEKDELRPSELNNLRAEFERIGMLNIPYGALFMRRHSTDASTQEWTARTRLSEETTGEDFEAAFALHDLIMQVHFRKVLTQARPYLSSHLQVNVTHVVHERTLVPAEFVFETHKPFILKARLDPWMVPLVSEFDGQKTPAEIYENAKNKSEIPENFAMTDFLDLVTKMIQSGFLLLPDQQLAVA